RRRLHERGRFLQPQSAADDLAVAEEIASPIRAFVRDSLVVDPSGSIPTAEAFDLWKAWCRPRNMHPGTDSSFLKNLRASVSGIRWHRPREGGEQVCSYKGLRRRPEAGRVGYTPLCWWLIGTQGDRPVLWIADVVAAAKAAGLLPASPSR